VLFLSLISFRFQDFAYGICGRQFSVGADLSWGYPIYCVICSVIQIFVRRYDGRVWSVFIWPRIGTGGGLL
jgi:hypothetical protein